MKCSVRGAKGRVRGDGSKVRVGVVMGPATGNSPVSVAPKGDRCLARVCPLLWAAVIASQEAQNERATTAQENPHRLNAQSLLRCPKPVLSFRSTSPGALRCPWVLAGERSTESVRHRAGLGSLWRSPVTATQSAWLRLDHHLGGQHTHFCGAGPLTTPMRANRIPEPTHSGTKPRGVST